MHKQPITVRGARVHNLKAVDLTLTPNQLIVFTGVSGSGKSSLAFDTLFVEGQRRYVESLSHFARRHLGDLTKPDVEHVSGLSPTISIEQKSTGRSPRSTVGTLTEIYDYLRVLYARIGIPHCPISGEVVRAQSKEEIIRSVTEMEPGTKILILASIAKGRKGEFKEEFQELLRKGFMRVRVDGEIFSLEEEIALDGSVTHHVDVVIDRLVISDAASGRIAESLFTALEIGEGLCSIAFTDGREDRLLSTHGYSPQSGLSYPPLEPQDFSFNHPIGMCETCQGLGETLDYALDKIIDPDRSIAEDCCSVASSYKTVRYGNIYDNLARIKDFDITTPWKALPRRAKQAFLYGLTGKKWVRMHFVHPKTGHEWSDYVSWKGVIEEARRRYSEAKSDLYRKNAEKLMSKQCCPSCKGSRLKPYPSVTTVGGKAIGNVTTMTLDEARDFFSELTLTPSETLIAEELLKEIKERLHFLIDVGLHYLTLDRMSPTLSGGEAQRVRLASQIGCGLVGVTYILDEPSIGLHPRDNQRLIGTLERLRDKGNTVIVVEHDEETIRAADRIVDFGPGAGVRGGEIVCDGSLHKLKKSKRSLTADYLTGRKEIAIPKKRRKGSGEKLTITGASHHNLKNVKVEIPLGLFVAVTGVSGSGKSSLITDILYPSLANTLHKAELPIGKCTSITGVEAIDKVIAIDQSAIGRNPRSNPSTYIKLLDEIRNLFAQLPEARARGYDAGRFSFNVKEGSCSACSGMGMVKVDMDFMEDQWVDCTACGGRRFDYETLSLHYKGKSIYDILEMDVAEALSFFENIPSLRKKLAVLHAVGMDYIKLGQPSPTLSGGEAQRIKLARELVRPATGKTLYILDEPTTGLHFHDISHLLEVLQALVDAGNSVLVIEHNSDVIKCADWLIDIGPDGGANGGEVIATGTPENIAKKDSPTGQFLKKTLAPISPSEKKELPKEKIAPIKALTVIDAEQNNLKKVDLQIPLHKMTVFTGPSGSGKSSLAFDTIYAEGQRRYVESLSPYARQFVQQMSKPKVGEIEGLSPAIAIEQKAHTGNPRSTIGTMTEIYDYLRIAFARRGVAHCPETGEKIEAVSKESVVETLLHYPKGEKLLILAPLTLKRGEEFQSLLDRYSKQGYLRIRLNGKVYRLEEEVAFDRRRRNDLMLVIDRLKVGAATRSRFFEAIELASQIGNGTLVVEREKEDVLFNLTFSVPSTGKSYPEINPHTFSFNAPEGMCLDCQGLGYQYGAQLADNKSILSQPVYRLLRTLWGDSAYVKAHQTLQKLLEAEEIASDTFIEKLSSEKLQVFLNGGNKWVEMEGGLRLRWVGINTILAKIGKSAHRSIRQIVLPLLDEHPCHSCHGTRLNPLARHVTLNGKTLGEVCDLPIKEVSPYIKQLEENKGSVLEEVFSQLSSRLHFLESVGLGYLSLGRRAPTLSGGESQRIRLARQLGTSLTGVLYVLDEPTIGLHPHNNQQLAQALNNLKKLGNTLLLVEHDPLTIASADNIVDFGPAAGEHGGEIIAQGSYKQLCRNPKSLTGSYLSGKEVIAPRKKRRKSTEVLRIKGAVLHNLQNVNVGFPIGTLCCVTGVSGSGKSTLINDLLRPAMQRTIGASNTCTYQGAIVEGIDAFDRLISVDQNPIGRTVRADVGTYCDILPPVRQFFAQLPAARALGLKPGNFSFNHRWGMCTNCWGLGYKKVQLHFLPAVRITCPECHGLRLNPVSLQVEYDRKNFGQHLDNTVEQARVIFDAHPKITRVLDTLIDVGLGYLKLGQRMQTLSGGEAQRIKLSKELSKRSYGRTLYLLDEPTTGLHSSDIAKLLAILQKIVDQGNTVIVIEHNTDIIRHADHIIDLGPGPGEEGGRVVYAGTVEGLSKCKESVTAPYVI